MRAKILFIFSLILLCGMISVHASPEATALTCPTSVFQGQTIKLDVRLVQGSWVYNKPINVTYPNGTTKSFITFANIALSLFPLANANQVGSYRFFGTDTGNVIQECYTWVEELTDESVRNSVIFVPTGMSFGVINKTFRHDWLIANPFNNVNISTVACKIYNANTFTYIKNASIIYDDKKVEAYANLTSATFSVGSTYFTNCSLRISVGTVNVSMNHMFQYLYVTREAQIKNELDTMYLIQRQQVNSTYRMFANLNSTYLNTRTLLNRTSRLNTTLNQINTSANTLKSNLTYISNVTRTNTGLLNSIKTTVNGLGTSITNIWNMVFRINKTTSKINSTLNSVNQTIVTNNTFIINQLREDRISTLS